MLPVIDKPLLRATERLLIWLEEWTGKDAAFWLTAVSCLWTTILALIIAGDDRGSDIWVDAGMLVLLVLTIALYYIPKKRQELERACRSQMPVRADRFLYSYGSVLRVFGYLGIAARAYGIIFHKHAAESAFVLGACCDVLCILFWLIVCADSYPATGGKKLKQKMTEIAASGAMLARSST